MRHIDTIERPETTTTLYAFEYHVIRNAVELQNIFEGYAGEVIVDGRSVRAEDFRPFILFRLDNDMRYELDISIADEAVKNGLDLPFEVRRPKYDGPDYLKGL